MVSTSPRKAKQVFQHQEPGPLPLGQPDRPESWELDIWPLRGQDYLRKEIPIHGHCSRWRAQGLSDLGGPRWSLWGLPGARAGSPPRVCLLLHQPGHFPHLAPPANTALWLHLSALFLYGPSLQGTACFRLSSQLNLSFFLGAKFYFVIPINVFNPFEASASLLCSFW
jgi:hypothetical protein